jgi:hypothetical protein
MDPSHKGSQEGMAKDEVLHHVGLSGVDYQGLACTVAVANRKTSHEDRHGIVLQDQRDYRSKLVIPNRKSG